MQFDAENFFVTGVSNNCGPNQLPCEIGSLSGAKALMSWCRVCCNSVVQSRSKPLSRRPSQIHSWRTTSPTMALPPCRRQTCCYH